MDRARTEAAHLAWVTATQDWNTRQTLLEAAEIAFAPLKSQPASPERSNAEGALIQRRAEVEDAKRIVDARQEEEKPVDRGQRFRLTEALHAFCDALASMKTKGGQPSEGRDAIRWFP